MTSYRYKAHDRETGQQVSDIIEAGSQAEAIARLKNMNLLPIEVKMDDKPKLKKGELRREDEYSSGKKGFDIRVTDVGIGAVILFALVMIAVICFKEYNRPKEIVIYTDHVEEPSEAAYSDDDVHVWVSPNDREMRRKFILEYIAAYMVAYQIKHGISCPPKKATDLAKEAWDSVSKTMGEINGTSNY